MFKKIILTAVIMFFVGGVTCWAGEITRTITMIEITEGTNFGFRIHLEGAPQICGEGGKTWAYINENDSNYQTYVSGLLAAKMSNTPVTLFTDQVDFGGGNKFCHIRHIQIN